MKTSITFSLAFLILLICSCDNLIAQISWLNTWEDAKNKSINVNKLIIADFTAEWCLPCEKMEKEVWNQPMLFPFASKLIYTKIDFDNSIPLNNKYDIDAIPAILIFDGFGTKLFHFIGYQNVDFIRNLINALPNDVTDLHITKNKLKSKPDDLMLKIELADIYRKYGMNELSNEHYESILYLDETQNNQELVDQVMTFMAVNYIFLNDPDEASDLFEDCIEEYPNSKYRPLHLFGQVKSNLMMDEEENAMEYYKLLITEYPNDKHTSWAKNLINEY